MMLNSVHSSERSRRPFANTHHANTGLDCRVLLVEDYPDDQRLFLRLLTRAGAEVTLECNGHAAVDRVMSAPDGQVPFDVIVMDVQMPELNGIAATRMLRQRGCQIPVIVLTAHDNPATRQSGIDAGCTKFMAKLPRPAQVVDAVRELSKQATAQ